MTPPHKVDVAGLCDRLLPRPRLDRQCLSQSGPGSGPVHERHEVGGRRIVSSLRKNRALRALGIYGRHRKPPGFVWVTRETEADDGIGSEAAGPGKKPTGQKFNVPELAKT